MKPFACLWWILLLLLTACTGTPAATPTPPAEPRALLAAVIDNLRGLNTFRLLIEQSGAPYVFGVTLDQGQTTVAATMQRAEGQYETPNVLYALTRLSIGGLPPINVEIFARGTDQWFKLVSTPWINFPIAEGFDPGRLIQQDSGFPRALQSLENLTYVAAETLDDGTAVEHVRGTAAGQVINDLMFGLLSLTQDSVQVDVYIDQAQQLPALLLVTLPGTATEAVPEDTVWRIEIYDINAEARIPYPDASTGQ
ncbi:MAG: LppX_LprAFG lipoprotein [Anaerolineae bacterium]|nr:LppX_LprAFG lipoprotein [Anaerolineae bacterium]